MRPRPPGRRARARARFSTQPLRVWTIVTTIAVAGALPVVVANCGGTIRGTDGPDGSPDTHQDSAGPGTDGGGMSDRTTLDARKDAEPLDSTRDSQGTPDVTTETAAPPIDVVETDGDLPPADVQVADVLPPDDVVPIDAGSSDVFGPEAGPTLDGPPTPEGSTACGTSACAPGDTCVTTFTFFGTCDPPFDGGVCVPPRVLFGSCCVESLGTSYSCRTTPKACAGTPSCACASALCNAFSGCACTGASGADLDCACSIP
jgi:hypothetical protein